MLKKKKKKKKNQNCGYRDVDVSYYVNFFETLCEKWLKYVFFLQLLKVNITNKSNICRLIC